MSKAKELNTTVNLVKSILEECPEARNNDDVLYLLVCRRTNDICVNLPFWKVLLNRKAYNLPAFESVRRSRQRLQAAYPELAGDENVDAQRMLNEEIFREFARGMV